MTKENKDAQYVDAGDTAPISLSPDDDYSDSEWLEDEYDETDDSPEDGSEDEEYEYVDDGLSEEEYEYLDEDESDEELADEYEYEEYEYVDDESVSDEYLDEAYEDDEYLDDGSEGDELVDEEGADDEYEYVDEDVDGEYAEEEYAGDGYEDQLGGDTTVLASAQSTYEEAVAKDGTRRFRLRIILASLAILLTLVGIYIMGVRRFSDRFLPNTSVYDCDVSTLTPDEATPVLDRETATYACTVKSGDYSATIPGMEITLERDEGKVAHDAQGLQSAYMWPIALLFHQRVEPQQEVTFDEGALANIVTMSANTYNNETLPTDKATISFDEASGQYVLGGSTQGEALDAGKVTELASQEMHAMHTSSELDPKVVYHQATVQDLPRYFQAVDNANRSRTTRVPLLVNGEEVMAAEPEQLSQWVTVEEAGPSVVVDQDALREWAEYYVQDAAYHKDDWNYYYLNNDEFVKGLSERLSAGIVDGYELPTVDQRTQEGASRDAAYEHTPWNSEMGRYIDVDLTSQFARLFDEKGEVLWESAFVSGSMWENHSTVEGVFNIYSMSLNETLVGLDYNNDGKPDYESFVNYWMPFYGGYGLHDATWRWSFGGDEYQYDGSHGCVNLPYEKAADLYGITFVGEVVYVHW